MVSKWIGILCLIAATSACAHEHANPDNLGACSKAWQEHIDRTLQTGDGQGHGPDIGSGEWKSVVEFKLGLRGQPNIPDRDSQDWCHYIDKALHQRSDTSAKQQEAASPAAGPTFSCDKLQPNSIEATICSDSTLSALDRELSDVYASALKKATNEHPPTLKAEQRGWIKGRDECWKSNDKPNCIQTSYQNRIAQLQAKYRLVPYTAPSIFSCDNNIAKEVVVTFFDTKPATLIAEFGDRSSLMYQQSSESGSLYKGRNETLWQKDRKAKITWGYNAPEMLCEAH